jgi:hypothetical protein
VSPTENPCGNALFLVVKSVVVVFSIFFAVKETSAGHAPQAAPWLEYFPAAHALQRESVEVVPSTKKHPDLQSDFDFDSDLQGSASLFPLQVLPLTQSSHVLSILADVDFTYPVPLGQLCITALHGLASFLSFQKLPTLQSSQTPRRFDDVGGATYPFPSGQSR